MSWEFHRNRRQDRNALCDGVSQQRVCRGYSLRHSKHSTSAFLTASDAALKVFPTSGNPIALPCFLRAWLCASPILVHVHSLGSSSTSSRYHRTDTQVTLPALGAVTSVGGLGDAYQTPASRSTMISFVHRCMGMLSLDFRLSR